MKLVTFTHSGATRLGIVAAEEVVDLAAAAPDQDPASLQRLRQLALLVEREIQSVEGAVDVALEQQLHVPTMTVKFDRHAIKRHSLRIGQVSAMTVGDHCHTEPFLGQHDHSRTPTGNASRMHHKFTPSIFRQEPPESVRPVLAES